MSWPVVSAVKRIILDSASNMITYMYMYIAGLHLSYGGGCWEGHPLKTCAIILLGLIKWIMLCNPNKKMHQE